MDKIGNIINSLTGSIGKLAVPIVIIVLVVMVGMKLKKRFLDK